MAEIIALYEAPQKLTSNSEHFFKNRVFGENLKIAKFRSKNFLKKPKN